MNTLTNERLNKIASWRKTYGDDHNVMMPAHEAEELVSRLLAAESQLAELRKQEPVAWRCMRNGPNAYVVTLSKTVADEWNSKGFPNVPLYSRPLSSQPYTVPDGWALVPIEPTEAMLILLGMTGSFDFMIEKYGNMLAAAPQHKGE
ncbi:hypothetical protein [Pectobacterium parmentieri]|uniref:hypothetical protein n=1 Tax=Pectobacterium parmentieri TaxID=1905730 RepID=UPI000D61FCEB|nr:hypothetical protein [Pectobacterium parmentieri]PWD66546.1 hypothetical protein DF211_01985 [Pectobacterium parmentieri]